MDIIQLKRGKLLDWQRENPVLEAGEIGIVFNSDTLVPLGMKIGNGFLSFNELPFISGEGVIDTYTREQIDGMVETLDNKISVVSTGLENLNSLISSQATVDNKVLSQSEIEELISSSGIAPTTEQLAAMNSGITSTVLSNILTALESIPSIFTIQKNGFDLPIENGIVNITVPIKTSDLTNDSGFVSNADLTPIQNEINLHVLNTSNPHAVTKSQVGLGNVDNTSDIDKPVSNAQALINSQLQETIDTKQPKITGQADYTSLLMTPPSSNGGQPGTIPKSTFANATAVESALAGKVDKIIGKGLSTNDFTDADNTKLSGIESGAEVNTIEGIKLNGASITPDANRVIDLGNIETAAEALILANRVSTLEGQMPNKADKVSSFIENDFVGLDANGNIKDSGKKAGDFATAAQGVKADSALQASDVDNALSTISENPIQNKVLANLIPNQASSENQLADKSFVNSSINNLAAYYITKNAAGDPFSTFAELHAATTVYSGGIQRIPTRNDYAVVLADESNYQYSAEVASVYGSWTTTSQYIGYYVEFDYNKVEVTALNKDSLNIIPGTTVPYTRNAPTTRYTYQGIWTTDGSNGWQFQYIINNSSFTAAQLEAINSGITNDLVVGYNTHIANKNNPHEVTKSQVGLSAVENERQYSANNPNFGTSTPSMDGVASVGVSTQYSRNDHVHPSDTSKVAKTTTIAGVDLQDNITESELRGAINEVVASDTSLGTTGSKGLMSPAQAEKLEGIETGAEVNEVVDVRIGGSSIVSSRMAIIQTQSAYNASSNKIATMADVSAFSLKIAAIESSAGQGLGKIIVPGQSTEYQYLISDVNATFSQVGKAELKLAEIANEETPVSISNFTANYENGKNWIKISGDNTVVQPENVRFTDCNLTLKLPGEGSSKPIANNFIGYLERSNLDIEFITTTGDVSKSPTGQSFTLVDSKFTIRNSADLADNNYGLVLDCTNSEVHIYDNSPQLNSVVIYEFRNCIDTTIYLHGHARVKFTNSTGEAPDITTYSHAGAKVVLCSDYTYSQSRMYVYGNEDSYIEVMSNPYVVSIIKSGETASIDNILNWTTSGNSFTASIPFMSTIASSGTFLVFTQGHYKGCHGSKYYPKVKTYSKTAANTFEEVYDSATINILDGTVTVYSDTDTPEYLVVIE